MAAVAVVCALTVIGCELDRTGLAPPPGRVATCTATIRGEGGLGVEFEVDGSDPEFADHLLATWCFSGSGGDEERALGEWASLLFDRTEAPWRRVMAPFRDAPGSWCVVEETLTFESCTFGMEVERTSFPPCSPSLRDPSRTLMICPDPPAAECLRVDPVIDFGTVPVGDSRMVTLEIANSCAEEIRLRAGESIVGADADAFAVAANRCAPPPGEDARQLAASGSPRDRCEVDVTFLPRNPLPREAEYRIIQEPAMRAVVQLRGVGLGARATVNPDSICLEPPLVGPERCTAPADFEITNPGPGGVRVVDGVFDPASGTGFRLVAPPSPAVDSFIAPSSTAILRVEWCETLASRPEEQAAYYLTLTTDTAATDTFELLVETP